MFHDKIREFLLGLLNRKDLPFMALTVDTTFEMTDGYVTVLVACFTEFVNSPAISVATMIQERKLGSTHRFFWEKVRQHFPEMCTANNVYVVSDEEKAIVDVMKEYIPNLPTFRCWNHIFTNAKLKLKKLKLDELEGRYVEEVDYLLNQESKLLYYKEKSRIQSQLHTVRKFPFTYLVIYLINQINY